MADTEDLSSRGPRSKRRVGRDGGSSTREPSTSTRRNGNGRQLSEMEVVVSALEALHRGDFGHRLRPRDGVSREVQDAFNGLAERLDHTALELARVSRVVGRDGIVQTLAPHLSAQERDQLEQSAAALRTAAAG